ncbi:MAG: SLC13 family permease [bacterium]|nr:SLC13 family permease [bacterium]
MSDLSESRPSRTLWQRAAMWLGPLAAAIIVFTVPEFTAEPVTGTTAAVVLTNSGIAVLALCVWMAVWWISECVPLEVTGLLPMVCLPLLGAVTMKQAAAPYADEVIALFLGGMLLGRAIERWEVHRWVGGHLAFVCGSSPRMHVLGLLASTAFISMWVSNLAAAMMMLPIARSMVPTRRGTTGRDDSTIAYTLAVAFGASIGGVGTLVGTPPTAQFAAFMSDRMDRPVSFLSWMLFGFPLVFLGVLGAWVVLTRVACRVPKRNDAAIDAPTSVGSSGLSSSGRRAVLVFAIAIAGWVAVPLLKRAGLSEQLPWLDRVSDAGIALGAALLMFLCPAGRGERRPILIWQEASQIPWGILVMFGGGMSLAATIQSSGLDRVIAFYGHGLGALPTPLLIMTVAVAATLLSEVMSNTALTALLLPIVSAIAVRIGLEPAVLMIPAVLGASLAFMMPAGTPPNAVAFATGTITMRDMIRAGFWLNVLFCTLTSVLVIAGHRWGLLPGM